MQTRRHFIQSTSLAGLSPFILNTSSFFDSKTSLKASLNPGSIGLKCSPQELLDFAIAYKFSAISPPMGALLQMNSIDQQNYLAKMKRHHIVLDSGGLPIEFRTSDEVFQKGLQYLKNNVKAIAALTIPSFVTWIMPTHKQLTYTQNFEQHRIRLQQIADVLSQEGLRLGLEYVGPKTLMARDKYAFIHTISELRELISAIETNNVGYLLDSFHTYCAEDQFEDMMNKALKCSKKAYNKMAKDGMAHVEKNYNFENFEKQVAADIQADKTATEEADKKAGLDKTYRGTSGRRKAQEAAAKLGSEYEVYVTNPSAKHVNAKEYAVRKKQEG